MVVSIGNSVLSLLGVSVHGGDVMSVNYKEEMIEEQIIKYSDMMFGMFAEISQLEELSQTDQLTVFLSSIFNVFIQYGAQMETEKDRENFYIAHKKALDHMVSEFKPALTNVWMIQDKDKQEFMQ